MIDKLLDNARLKTFEWINYYCQELDKKEADPELALTYLRATLQTLRDTLVLNEAVQLGGQLPLLIRGFYYENWSINMKPKTARRKEVFLEAVQDKLNRTFPYVDHEQATRAAMHTILGKISEGEMEDVVSNLHYRVRDIFESLPQRQARLV